LTQQQLAVLQQALASGVQIKGAGDQQMQQLAAVLQQQQLRAAGSQAGVGPGGGQPINTGLMGLAVAAGVAPQPQPQQQQQQHMVMSAAAGGATAQRLAALQMMSMSQGLPVMSAAPVAPGGPPGIPMDLMGAGLGAPGGWPAQG
jgi:hypothetical protein